MAKLSTQSETIERDDGTKTEITLALDTHRRVDTAYEIYLGLHQALTGPEERQKLFKELSPDFFDLIKSAMSTSTTSRRVSTYGRINTRFVMIALTSESMQSLIDANATGMTAKGIKAAKLKPLPIPIPPLAEQSRIVAKVDELMSLCDRMEASLASADTHRRRLLEALLYEVLVPAEALAAAA